MCIWNIIWYYRVLTLCHVLSQLPELKITLFRIFTELSLTKFIEMKRVSIQELQQVNSFQLETNTSLWTFVLVLSPINIKLSGCNSLFRGQLQQVVYLILLNLYHSWKAFFSKISVMSCNITEIWNMTSLFDFHFALILCFVNFQADNCNNWKETFGHCSSYVDPDIFVLAHKK